MGPRSFDGPSAGGSSSPADAFVEADRPSVVQRAPPPVLRPFVALLWATDERFAPRAAARELVLPTGAMHLVVRLSHPLRIFDGIDDPAGDLVGHAVVGGARSAPYVRDVSQPARSVGAQLLPGAADLLFGAPADAMAERHTRLDDVWGRFADEVRERLAEAGSPERQLDVFESLLIARLPKIRGLHPAVARALGRFGETADVRAVVDESGYSHRQFIALFRRAVGLAPKVYCRVLRLQRALARLAARPDASLAELAMDAGYSDQPHLNRDFRELAGMAPGQYRDRSPSFSHHVPIERPRR